MIFTGTNMNLITAPFRHHKVGDHRPVFDQAKQKVIGSIDIESELRDAFSPDVQALLERCADVIATLW